MGIDESKIEDVLESFEKAKAQEGKTKIKEEENVWRALVKYFAHGLGFSILFGLLLFVWVAIFVVLVIGALIIGLIIGIGLLVLFVGFINSFLMSVIWGFSMKTSFWSIISHGIVLLIGLVIVGIIFIIPQLVDPSITTQILMLVVGSIPRGFVAKKIGEMWEGEERSGEIQYTIPEKL
ncbi:MAG: hypothetical protein OEY22_09635 [Candidatus Bathyarchaeota archaeon]|nr:hypothetical protein [Candidatus Bathyarchaeota archaeon]MDH5787231.1 hypothetical protein [Candidatus Bathyarchaeota archaeon]